MYLVSRTRTLSAKDLEDAAKYKLKDNWYMFSSQLEEINLSSTEISMKGLPWGKQALPINTFASPLKTREMSTIRSLGWVYRIKAKIFFCVLIMMNAILSPNYCFIGNRTDTHSHLLSLKTSG